MTLLLLLPAVLGLSENGVEITEIIGTDSFGELLAFIYNSFFLMFADYIPSSGQLAFGAAIALVLLYMSAKKTKKNRKDRDERYRSDSHGRR